MPHLVNHKIILHSNLYNQQPAAANNSYTYIIQNTNIDINMNYQLFDIFSVRYKIKMWSGMLAL